MSDFRAVCVDPSAEAEATGGDHETMTPRLTTRQLALAIAAYKVAVTALAKGGWLTSTEASSLTILAGNLTLT